LFAREGWVSHAVGSGAEAERWLALQRPALVFDDLRIDLPRREASVQGQVVPLTSVEFKILLALVSAGSAACSRELLAAAAQVSGYRPLDRTVDVQIGRLRRKLCAARPGPEWIVTLRGQGYAFQPGTATQQG
jgi:two-component system phosphate regulon response regulator OmpR